MGGQERRVLAESVGMRERGHEVWIATPPGGALADRAAEVGIEVIPMSFRRRSLPWSALNVASLVRRVRPDVVNSHSSADSWAVALAGRMGPRPRALVRSRHISAGVAPGPLHRFLYGQADHLITTGETIRRDLAASGLVPLERSTSIPTGVDPDRFAPNAAGRTEARRKLGLDGTGPVIGVVAYLRPDKGHQVLLRAMPEIVRQQPDCVLLVVGDGSQRSVLESMTVDYGLEARVRFLGAREDIPAVLCALDVFCLPSIRNEGVPQSVLQASAAGLPVVSTAVGGIPEAVIEGKTGIVVPPGDARSLAEALAALLADPECRDRMGHAGRRHVKDVFSLREMLDRTESAYEEALLAGAADGRGRRVTGVN
jgi:glycosyltransferase involved in cell wall biosynthesis